MQNAQAQADNSSQQDQETILNLRAQLQKLEQEKLELDETVEALLDSNQQLESQILELKNKAPSNVQSPLKPKQDQLYQNQDEELSTLQAKLEKLELEKQELDETVEALLDSNQQFEANVKKLEQAINDKEIQCSKLQGDLQLLQSQQLPQSGNQQASQDSVQVIVQLNSKIQELEQEKKEQDETLEALLDSNSQFEANIKQLETTINNKDVAYNKLQEDLKTLEAQVQAQASSTDSKQIEEELTKLQSKIQELEQEKKEQDETLEALLDSNSQFEANIKQLETTINNKDASYTKLQGDLKTLEAQVQAQASSTDSKQIEEELTKLQSKIQELEQEKKEQDETLEALLDSNQQFEANIKQLETTISNKDASYTKLQGDLKTLEAQVQAQASSTDSKQIEEELTKLQSKIQELEQEKKEQDETLEALLDSNQQFEANIKQLETTISNKDASYTKLQGDLKTLEAQVQAQASSTDSKQIEEELTKLQSKIQELEQEKKEQDETLEALLDSNQQFEANIKQLETTISNKDVAYNKLQEDLKTLEAQVQAQASSTNSKEIEEELTKLQTKIQELEQEKKEQDETLEALLDSNSQFEANIKQLETTINNKDVAYNKLQEDLKTLEAQVQAQASSTDSKQIEEELTKLQSKIQELEQEKKEQDETLEALLDSNSQFEANIKQLETTISNKDAALTKINQQQQQGTVNNAASEEQDLIIELNEKFQKLEEEKQELEETLEALQDQNTTLQQNIIELNNQLQLKSQSQDQQQAENQKLETEGDSMGQEQVLALKTQVQNIETTNSNQQEYIESLNKRLSQKEEIIVEIQEELQSYETESKNMAQKMELLLNEKLRIQELNNLAEQRLKNFQELFDENQELTLMMKQSQDTINQLQSTNEYQTKYLQLDEEYNEFKSAAQQLIEQKEQDLQMAAQCLENYDQLQETVKILEDSNKLLSQQLNGESSKYNELFNQHEQLKSLTQPGTMEQKEVLIKQLTEKLDQIRNELESTKEENYNQSELIKDLQIQVETLEQIECQSPVKITKLQQDYSQSKTELQKVQEEANREIHILKNEKNKMKQELSEYQQLLESMICESGELFEPQLAHIQELRVKLLERQEESASLLEKKEMEISGYQEQLELIKLTQSGQDIPIKQVKTEVKAQLRNIDTQTSSIDDFATYTDGIIEQLINNKLISTIPILQLHDSNNKSNQNQPKVIKLQKVQTSQLQQQQLESITIVQQSQQKVGKPIAQQQHKQSTPEDIFQEYTEVIIQNILNNNVKTLASNNLIIGKHNQSTQTLLDQNQQSQIVPLQTIINDQEQASFVQLKQEPIMQISMDAGLQSSQMLQFNNGHTENSQQLEQSEYKYNLASSQDHSIYKKKTEEYEALWKNLERENQSLKEKLKRSEEKVTPNRKYSEIKQRTSLESDYKEQIAKQAKIIKDYEYQIYQFKDSEMLKAQEDLQEQIKVLKFENEQLLEEIQSINEQMKESKRKTQKLQNDLSTIYNLGPQALEQLQGPEPIIIEQPVKVVNDKLNVQQYLYIKAQRNFQSPYLEFNRKTLKFFSQVKNRIEKSIFDTYHFDEVFFEAQKIHQFLDYSNRTKYNAKTENNRVFLILGQPKTYKKMILLMLLEQIYTTIIKEESTQRIVIQYSDRIGRNQYEYEPLTLDVVIDANNQKQGLQDLEFCVQNIKIHLLTKQTKQQNQEKVRKLTIMHQILYNSQVQCQSQIVIATSNVVPKGEFKDVVLKIANHAVNPQFQYNCFYNLTPSLTNYQKCQEVLSFMKTVKSFKSFEPASSRFCQESQQMSQIDTEISKVLRSANNKLVLKNQEIEQLKKQTELFRKHWNEGQAKYEQTAQQMNTVMCQLQNLSTEIKTKINIKVSMKKSSLKKSNNLIFLDKLVQFLDAMMRKIQPQQSMMLDSPQRYRSCASEIINPFTQ